MTDPVAPTAPAIPPTVPNRANRAGFPTQMYNFFTWMAGDGIDDMEALADNAYTNALAADERAVAAAADVASTAADVISTAGDVVTTVAAAAAAAASAATAVAAPGTSATSTTSLTIGTGPQSLTIQTGKDLVPGMFVNVSNTANPSTKHMYGVITAYNSGTGALDVDVDTAKGSGTYTAWTVSLVGGPGAAFTGGDLSSAMNYARVTVASAATTADIWSAAGNQIDFTGTATVTGFPAASQAGAERVLICAGACSFTAGANMLIDGVTSGNTVTCAANDTVIVRAVSTTQFRLTRLPYAGITTGKHIVELNSGNGYGSTNTKVRRYTTTKQNIGTAITYADSASDGMGFTINETGLYELYVMDQRSSGGAEIVGFSVNSSELTTSVVSITAADIVGVGRMTADATNGNYCQLTISAYFTAGDVVRMHDAGTNDATGADYSKCRILKIGA